MKFRAAFTPSKASSQAPLIVVTESELTLEGSLYNKTIPKSMLKPAPNAPMLNANRREEIR